MAEHDDKQKLRPCMKSEQQCSDCDGEMRSCSLNFCSDLGITPAKQPTQSQLSSLYDARMMKQAEWLRQQYGFTSKETFVNHITNILFEKTSKKTLGSSLSEAAWQIAHLEFVIQRMSEDYSDLILIAEQMGDSLMAFQALAMREVSGALADWTVFQNWLYNEPDDTDDEDNEDDEDDEA